MKWTTVAYALLLSLCVGRAEAAEPVALGDLTGEWANETWLERLKETKSPKQAVAGIYYTGMAFAPEDSLYEWGVWFNFHDGLRYRLTGLRPAEPEGAYIPEFGDQQDAMRHSTDDTLLFDESRPVETLVWSFTGLYDGKQRHKFVRCEPSIELIGLYDGKQRHKFVRCEPSIELMANRIVLAGRYTDEQGRTYEFTGDCTARWPEETFAYRFGIDYVLNKYNYLFRKEWDGKHFEGNAYSFEWVDGKLLLYDVTASRESTDFFNRGDEPFAVLTPGNEE